MFEIKRIYEDPADADGERVLVDRLWPRGISKEKAKLSKWMKEVAPSPDLRKEFNHKPEKFEQFREEYLKELKMDEKKEDIDWLHEKAADGKVTLLYGAKDEKHNHAIVLKEYLENEKG
ncbi:DUF488 domain-containing protein [Falsibacillus pallidus]|uniref:Uncharacterized protein YeaO (DUF488 family) n=1 Tax=Falsibacillus pallidus TaxID=493781 RepID=A0A370GJY2_9BACI|nr:DUF488 family protein [Falsibacillus pallidus]RDI42253.1 uncharacterized protein YeaO (DUF488 family) [Falsibacillus pallidus]